MNKLIIGGALAGAALLGALAVSYGQAQEQSQSQNQSLSQNKSGPSAFSDLQKDEIERLIADYIAENPEALIDSLNRFSEQQRARQQVNARDAAQRNLAALLDEDGAFIAGKNPDKADVSVIEFYDYHCTFCKRVTGLVQEITQSDEAVKVVFRELPILKDESEIAARYALAAKDQGKFLDYHVALMKANGTLTEQRVIDIARDVGLDTKKLKSSAEAIARSNVLDRNQDFAREIGVSGTPTFVVASADQSVVEIIPGYDPEALTQAIEKAKRAR